LTAAAVDPLADICRAMPESDSGVLATLEILDCLRFHESNFFEIQNYPAHCRLLAQQALQLGHCLCVDPTSHELEDPLPD